MNESILITIVLMGLITYLTRFPLLVISSRIALPAWLKRGLMMVPIGVFTSLTVPALFFHTQDGRWSEEYLVAGIVSLAVGLWKRQIVYSLLVGILWIVLYRNLF
ncbi:AzlD domain-containing protein [Brevibacillus migulae]|uniref:AzlD domain-containing protein n=1 Tax=Brevibacillus migulae TaxID=1644114 RepID=UPI001F42915A|nr:AzlD domain-containing protein [Brevibacillus migulae]